MKKQILRLKSAEGVARFKKGDFLYGVRNSQILTSDNHWTTTNYITALPGNPAVQTDIKCLHVSDSGAIFASLPRNSYSGSALPGRLYRIKDGKSTAVLDFAVAGAYASYWSIASFGSKIIVGEYGTKSAVNPSDNARRVYLSTDDGATFTQIWIADAAVGVHIHAVGIDPYTEDVWICHGDDVRRIIKIPSPYTTPETISILDQPTSIAFTPDYVLFGQDYYRANGILRYKKADGVLDQVLSLVAPYSWPSWDNIHYDKTSQTAWFATVLTGTPNSASKWAIWTSTAPFSNWVKVYEADRTSGVMGVQRILGINRGELLLTVQTDDLKDRTASLSI